MTVKKQKGKVVCVRIVLTSCEWERIYWAYKKKGVKKLRKGSSNLKVTKKPNPKHPLVGPFLFLFLVLFRRLFLFLGFDSDARMDRGCCHLSQPPFPYLLSPLDRCRFLFFFLFFLCCFLFLVVFVVVVLMAAPPRRRFRTPTRRPGKLVSRCRAKAFLRLVM